MAIPPLKVTSLVLARRGATTIARKALQNHHGLKNGRDEIAYPMITRHLQTKNVCLFTIDHFP
jgi:hypothetical protein